MTDKLSNNMGLGMTRRSFAAAAGIVCASLMLPSSFAIASPTWGSSTKRTVSGVAYTYLSGAELGTNPCAYTKITSSATVAASTMAARAIVVKETNLNIVTASKWAYNARGTSIQASVASSALKLGCRSAGKVTISGVSGQLSCSPIKLRSLPPELPVNASGQTYGNYGDVEAGSVPDLIAIVADSGLEGYAFYEQFSAEDAPDSIPVYNVDGATQIGIFTFGDK